MRESLKQYLLVNTPQSSTPIPDGVRGELSKITEEYLELVDSIKQQNRKLTYIECCDLIDSVLRFHSKQFKSPSPVGLCVVYLRRLYKPIRNRVYDFVGLNKETFNQTSKAQYEVV